MRVTVTGGAGKLGGFVVTRLISRGHRVTVFDRSCSAALDATIVTGDVLDLTAVLKAAEGSDAIIHLAGIPANGICPDQQTFSINTAAAFNIHEAARILSIPRVITMSSEGVLGWAPHSPTRAPLPEYLPVDESHPCRPQDAYGLSKLVSEQIAQSFALRCGIEAIALRPPRIVGPSELIELHERRGLRPTKFSLLHYVDVRDLARACEAAVTIQHSGFVALFVGSGESLVDEPLSATFARLVPELAAKASCIPAASGAVSIEKAQSTLGWSPMFSWRMSPGEMQVRSKQTEGV